MVEKSAASARMAAAAERAVAAAARAEALEVGRCCGGIEAPLSLPLSIFGAFRLIVPVGDCVRVCVREHALVCLCLWVHVWLCVCARPCLCACAFVFVRSCFGAFSVGGPCIRSFCVWVLACRWT